jgi:hypothetical protein
VAAHSRLLTIYNCGTAFTRDRGTSLTPGTAGELVAHLYDKAAAPDINNFGRLDLESYHFKLIHDGPGSAPSAFGKWEKNAQGVRQPVQHPASDSKAATPGSGLFDKLPQALKQGIGQAFGTGWGANVDHAVSVVKALRKKPDAINLIGWSRGAITCHMIANALHGDADTSLRQIPVNIFAVDPVPGGRFGAHGRDKVDVAGNVARYRGVFAIHDRKLGFRAAVVSRKDAGDRDIVFYAMPGVHDTVVQGATGLVAVAALVEHLAVEFLEANGSAFGSGVIRMSPQEICENYAIAMKTMADYEALAGQGALNMFLGLLGYAPAPHRQALPGGVEADQRPDAFNDFRRAYFVNSHHEAAFSVAFPQAYALLFAPRNLRAALTPDEVKGFYDFKAMKNRCRNSYEQLVKKLGG